jgi:tRNA nucleotidyltransferase (CCA-adding enzyme)
MNPRAILEHLPEPIKQVTETARASLRRGHLYLVGGTVRDALLHAALNDHALVNDLDLVVENTNASELAAQLHQKLGGTLEQHKAFGTATLKLESLLVDIATARRERYDPPGTLPKITFSTITDDLARRDFSVNALAFLLQPEPLAFLDPHHGLADLSTKQLRILYPNSFIDDPTRILRGARLAGRLGFSWEEGTRLAISKALASLTLVNVSHDRLKNELELTLEETKVTPALELLSECKALAVMLNLTLNSTVTNRLDVLRQTFDVPSKSYMLTLLLMKPEAELNHWLETFNYSPRYLESIKRLREIEATGSLSSAQFAKLSDAEKITARALSDTLDERIQNLTLQFKERRLTGQDVLDLGLEPGPMVGIVLAHVAKARDAGTVHTFDDELALAKHLVQVMEKL